MTAIIDPTKWQTEHLPGLKPFDPYDPDYMYDPEGPERWNAEQTASLLWNMKLHLPHEIKNAKMLAPAWGTIITLADGSKSFFGVAAYCERGKHSPKQDEFEKMHAAQAQGREAERPLQYAKPIFACQHCAEQDPVHPNGIVLMPHGFYVCQKCFNLMERRKFKHAHELFFQCHHCVKDEIDRILLIDPSLFVDLMLKPKG